MGGLTCVWFLDSFCLQLSMVKGWGGEIMSDLHNVYVRLHITMSAKAENGIKISKPPEKRPTGLENSAFVVWCQSFSEWNEEFV